MQKDDKNNQIQKERNDDGRQTAAGHQSSNTFSMLPVTKEAYGGGLYGKEEGKREQDNKPNENKPPASDTQSADGPAEATTTTVHLKHKTPPSSGDCGRDITGQSYIQ